MDLASRTSLVLTVRGLLAFFLVCSQTDDELFRLIDFLQYTVTSRKEMPNAQFTAQLDKAANDLRTLFGAREQIKSKL